MECETVVSQRQTRCQTTVWHFSLSFKLIAVGFSLAVYLTTQQSLAEFLAALGG